MKDVIIRIEKEAAEESIPIIEKDSIKFIMKYIKLNNVKSILEIGTAIGYSAILMASVSDDIEITTIERDRDRYDLAVSNIKKYRSGRMFFHFFKTCVKSSKHQLIINVTMYQIFFPLFIFITH